MSIELATLRNLGATSLLIAAVGAVLFALAVFAQVADEEFVPPPLYSQPLPDRDSAGAIDLPGNVTFLQDITYKSVVGYRPLKLDLYLPRERSTTHPLVLWVHGGGFEMGDPRNDWTYGDWRLVLAELASRGFVVAGITYRLSGEAAYPAQLEDAQDSLHFLHRNADLWGIDSDKTIAWGLSAGGTLVSLLATECVEDNCVDGVVNWFGPTDFTAMGGKATLTKLLGCGDATCSDEELASVSAVKHLDSNLPPFVFMHGEDDPLVPVAQSIAMAERLEQLGVESTLLTYPGLSHGFEGGTPEKLREILDTTFDQIEKLVPVDD